VLATALVPAGLTGWAVCAGNYPLMAGSAVWGLGFASSNSMQQVRLVAADPPLAPASVSLNTSVLYLGQAVGSAIGGLLYARDLLHGLGYVSMGFLILALGLVVLSRPGRAPLEAGPTLLRAEGGFGAWQTEPDGIKALLTRRRSPASPSTIPCPRQHQSMKVM